MKTLLDECIECLGEDVILIEGKEAESLNDRMLETFKFGRHGVDWKSYEHVFEIHSIKQVEEILGDKECYIIWDEFTLPILRSRIANVTTYVDDVTAVAFDTRLVGINFNWIIEFHHEGTIKGVVL